MKNRFELLEDADTTEEAILYLKLRGKQLLRFGIYFLDYNVLPGGNVVAYFQDRYSRDYVALFILKSNRSQGQYGRHLEKDIYPDFDSYNKPKIITMPSCNIAFYLRKNKIPHRIVDPRFLSEGLGSPVFKSYITISKYWCGKHAKRSGVPYMNHVDEGLAIINMIYGFEQHTYAAQIFALHGVLQEYYKEGICDEYNPYELRPNRLLSHIDAEVVIGAMEYRAVANSYLAHHDNDTPIVLSEDPNVNIALVADKIQNRKDFELYHKGKHKNSDRLDEYFKQWLKALNISEKMYEDTKDILLATD